MKTLREPNKAKIRNQNKQVEEHKLIYNHRYRKG